MTASPINPNPRYGLYIYDDTPGGHMSEIARWCLITAAFTLTLPLGVVGGFYAVALAVGR